jgi:RNA polymerase sigma-70 factor (ECF subfamily)
MVEASDRRDDAAADTVLIKAFLGGERQAFDRLVLKYQDRVFRICLRFLGDKDEADDAAQETFVRAYRGLAKFRGEAQFSTWLYRVTVNTCKNKLGSLAWRLKRKILRYSVPEQEGGAAEQADRGRDPQDQLEQDETKRILARAIAELPADQKLVVTLRDIEGLSYQQVAAVSGDNLGTVKSKLSRARGSLRDKLEKRLR